MQVRALFFASYRELAGTDVLEVELPADASVRDLLARLQALHPRLSALPVAPAVAINLDYAELDARLNAEDEVAFIPPVAGG